MSPAQQAAAVRNLASAVATATKGLASMAGNISNWADRVNFDIAMSEFRPSVSLLPDALRTKYFERTYSELNPTLEKYLPDIDKAAANVNYNPKIHAPIILDIWNSKNGNLADLVNMTDAEMTAANPNTNPKLNALIRQMAATLDMLPAEANFIGRSSYDLTRQLYTQNPKLQTAPGVGTYTPPTQVAGFMKYSKNVPPGQGVAARTQDPLALVRSHVYGSAVQKAYNPISKQYWNNKGKQTQFEPDTFFENLNNVINDPFTDPIQRAIS